MSKFFFYDLETSGVDHTANGIHQIAVKIETPVATGEWDWKVRPRPGCVIEDAALKVGNVTREQIEAYPPMGRIYREMIDVLSHHCDRYDKRDKMYLVGFNNTGFDNKFLRRFFEDNGDVYFNSWFYSNSIDMMAYATVPLMDKRADMPNFKLKTVAATLGIEVDESKLHDAYYDLDLTKQMFDKLCRPVMNAAEATA